MPARVPDVPVSRIRRLYRVLLRAWGDGSRSLYLVRIPLLRWSDDRTVVMAGPGEVLVLARPRGDRRVEVAHRNRQATLAFSTGRLEPDPAAPWSAPLRLLTYQWLESREVLCGVDAAVEVEGVSSSGAEADVALAVGVALACLQAEQLPPVARWPALWEPVARALHEVATGREGTLAPPGGIGGAPASGATGWVPWPAWSWEANGPVLEWRPVGGTTAAPGGTRAGLMLCRLGRGAPGGAASP